MRKRQFHVLYREFLFRMVDVEALSSYAQGDSNRLLGRFASLLIFASLTRIVQYLHNRSLWMDEAALGLNIQNRDFAGLFQPLSNDQGAPVPFLLATKTLYSIFGGSEFVLVCVAVGDAVSVALGVADSVGVTDVRLVAVAVASAVPVAVGLGDKVGVGVGNALPVLLGVGLGVSVGDGVSVGVGVRVSVGPGWLPVVAVADGEQRALTRLIAGLLGVGFDDLWQREQRRKRIRRAIAVLQVAGIAAAVVGVIATGTWWSSMLTA